MGTKLQPGKFDCYDNAEPDEPMFILLARDLMAPALVRLWADLRAHAAGNPSKVAEARSCAAAMDVWRNQKSATPPPLKEPEAGTMTSRKLLILNARSIAKDQRVHGGKMGPDLGKLIVALCDELEALSLLPPAQGKVGKFDVSNCRKCGQFMGHGHECAAPPLPVDRETTEQQKDDEIHVSRTGKLG